jgi:CBS-domain-containing membrane protein
MFSSLMARIPNRVVEVDDIVEQPPRRYSWLPFFLIFILTTFFMVGLTNWRFILFPPLVVIGFEMFAHSDVCPWADKPVLLVIACTLTAAAGVSIVMAMGAGPFAVILAMTIAIGVLKVSKLHVPPALAVGLLPFVIDHPDYRFPLAVGIGTAALAATYISYRAFSRRIQDQL